MVAASGVMPRRPVERDRRFVLKILQRAAQHDLVRAQHALRVDDALRHAGGTRGKKKLRDGVAVYSLVRGVDCRRRLCLRKIGEQRRLPRFERILRNDDFDIGGHDRFDGFFEGRAIGDKDQSGSKQLENVPELSIVSRNQGVGGRNRRVGDPGVHRTERQHLVIHAVAGKDDHRPFCRKIARKQRLAVALCKRKRFGIGDLAPLAAFVALRHEHAVRRFFRPQFEALGDLFGIGRELVLARHIDGSVGASVDDRLEPAQANLAYRNFVCGAFFVPHGVGHSALLNYRSRFPALSF